jgi:hypothetical protein
LVKGRSPLGTSMGGSSVGPASARKGFVAGTSAGTASSGTEPGVPLFVPR